MATWLHGFKNVTRQTTGVTCGLAFFLMGSLGGHNTLTWMVLLLGFLSAGVYNFKVCEFQAERLDGA